MLNNKENRTKSLNLKIFKSWEFTLFILLIVIFIINIILSPDLFRIDNLLDATRTFMEKSIMAIPMTLLIIAGFIDISIASIAAMSGVILGVCYKAGVNIWVCVVIALVAGLTAGLINGLIVTKIKIPSIFVTLAMLFFYRGIAYILLGDTAVRELPERFGLLGGAYSVFIIPFSLIIFVVLAIVFGLVLHYTTFGRCVYAIGNNENTARYSGIPVDKIRIILTTINGLIAGLSGVLLTSRLSSARPDMATGQELAVITIVLLGGVYIFGGRGSILGVVISAFVIGYVFYGLLLINMQTVVITMIIGAILIIALLIPRFSEIISNVRRKRIIKS